MITTEIHRWARFTIGAAVVFCMLGFYRTEAQDPDGSHQPFANAVVQRFEMINQLKEMNAQLKEQNALLRSGQMVVVIAEKKP